MSVQNENLRIQTAKPVVAGVFNIVVGSFCLLGVLGLGTLSLVFIPFIPHFHANLGIIFWLAAIPLTGLGVVSIIGGIYGLQRRAWGWALAGSITTTCVSNLVGLVSIILTAISKDEFEDN